MGIIIFPSKTKPNWDCFSFPIATSTWAFMATTKTENRRCPLGPPIIRNAYLPLPPSVVPIPVPRQIQMAISQNAKTSKSENSGNVTHKQAHRYNAQICDYIYIEWRADYTHLSTIYISITQHTIYIYLEIGGDTRWQEQSEHEEEHKHEQHRRRQRTIARRERQRGTGRGYFLPPKMYFSDTLCILHYFGFSGKSIYSTVWCVFRFLRKVLELRKLQIAKIAP